MSEREQELLADRMYRRVAWRLIPLLILCYLSAFIDRSNIGIAKLAFMPDLGITETMFGLAGGLFYLGYSLFEIPGNLLLDRFGARRTFCRILLLWSGFTLLAAGMTGAWQLYTLRFLIGAAEAGFFPGVLLYLSRWAPAARRARFTAWFMSAMAIAGLISGPVSGLILAHMEGIGGLAGWRWLFILEGAPGIVLGLLVLRWLPDGPADARWLNAGQRALIERDLCSEAPRLHPGRPGSLISALHDPVFYALSAMSAALIAGIGGIALWMPTLLKASGIGGNALSATLTAIPYACALVSQQWLARRSDRLQERRLHSALPVLIAALAWLCMALVPGLPWAMLLLLTIATAATFGATGPFWSLPPTYLAGPAAPAGIAAVTTLGSVAAFVSPIVVGWAADRWPAAQAGAVYYGLLLLAGSGSLLIGTSAIMQRTLPPPTRSMVGTGTTTSSST